MNSSHSRSFFHGEWNVKCSCTNTGCTHFKGTVKIKIILLVVLIDYDSTIAKEKENKATLLPQAEAWQARRDARTRNGWECRLEVLARARRDVMDLNGVCLGLVNVLSLDIDYIPFWRSRRLELVSYLPQGPKCRKQILCNL